MCVGVLRPNSGPAEPNKPASKHLQSLWARLQSLSDLERGECHVSSRVWGKSVEDLESGRRSREVKRCQPLRADPKALGTREVPGAGVGGHWGVLCDCRWASGSPPHTQGQLGSG